MFFNMAATTDESSPIFFFFFFFFFQIFCISYKHFHKDVQLLVIFTANLGKTVKLTVTMIATLDE